jgi:DNA-binding XRE family transcriptional regulator
MGSPTFRRRVLVGCILTGLITSTGSAATPGGETPALRALDQTSGGALLATVQPAGAAISELRRRSGLTWDQLAHIFSVSRRSLHFWASGQAMSSSNEERLQRVLATMRQIDRGSASENRAALLRPTPDGALPFDLLVAGEYAQALSALGSGAGTPRVAPRPRRSALAARAPHPPETLVSALQDRPSGSTGRLSQSTSIATLGRSRWTHPTDE